MGTRPLLGLLSGNMRNGCGTPEPYELGRSDTTLARRKYTIWTRIEQTNSLNNEF